MALTKPKSQLNRFLSWHYRDYALLGLLIMTAIALNLIWVALETRPPHWDMARHLWNSLHYHQVFREGLVTELFQSYRYYPPLLYWVTIPFYAIGGNSIMSAVATNVIFIGILVFSVYGIGRYLWNSRVGLLAAILILTNPMLITQFKEYQIDAPLTAMVALSMLLLIRSKEFSHRLFTLCFGASLGLGVLTKWTFPFFLLFPTAVALILALTRDWKERRPPRLVNFLWGALLAYAIASPWYLANHVQLKIDVLVNSSQAGISEGDPIVGSLASNLWYLGNLIHNQLYLVPSLLFLIGLGWVFRYSSWRKNLYPLLLVSGTFIVFTLLRNKDARYTLPLLSGVVIIAAYWITQLPPKWEKLLSWGIGIYSAATFWLISFGPSHINLVVPVLNIPLFTAHGYLIGPPSGEDWYQEELFTELSKAPPEERSLYYEGPDTIWFNHWGMIYYATKYQVALAPEEKANFVAIRGKPRDSVLIKHIFLPDGSELFLYRRNGKAPAEAGA